MAIKTEYPYIVLDERGMPVIEGTTLKIFELVVRSMLCALFCDTSFFYAALDRRDRDHPSARRLAESIQDRNLKSLPLASRLYRVMPRSLEVCRDGQGLNY